MRTCALILFVLCFAIPVESQVQNSFTESLGNVKLNFSLDDMGSPHYEVSYKNKAVIKKSLLGFKISGAPLGPFIVKGTVTKSADETWSPVWGEVKEIRDKHKQLTISLQEKHTPNRLLNIIFRVFDDGVGFRYEFPLQPKLKHFVISDELTEFNVSGDHKTFWIPGDYDSNEYAYTTSPLSQVDAWKLPLISNGSKEENMPDQFAVQTPLMMKSIDGLYINIHEAALVDYSSMQLHVDRANYKLSAHLVPAPSGQKVYLRAPVKTPWRTVLVSDKAAEILTSKTILNLNEPSKVVNTSWIRPMKYIGIWWEMQTNKGSWSYSDNLDSVSATGSLFPNERHSANTSNVKKYIDFASNHGISGLLVEGWNTGWEEWFGTFHDKEFDFVTPYPDFDVVGIMNYAKRKNVQMIMHNETGGSVDLYERQMDTAFRFMNRFGYPAVKTGYVGRIIPRGEHHDGQWMVNHYIHAAEKAARYKVMINMHEPVRPTGLHRTYPNWLANEAARGNEFNAFSEGNQPEHETILPFTRLMGGPMDYTPGIFKIRNYSKEVPGRQVHTTLAKQLALYITMYSPLQMAADLPENYEAHMDAFQFIKDVPVDWDDTRILEAEPGDYLTIARKEKGKDAWFIGSITDERNRSSEISLDFLTLGKKYTATIYADGDKADWKSNPEAYKITSQKVDSKTKLKLKVAPGGGYAISIVGER